ncbi:MAG: HAD family hydrolase [Deltaproteobacteria bacterium]|nr:HAD family hydrolase [Deltaproteobacteria bacterium]
MGYAIVLFDVDGTLLDSSGAGRRALEVTFRELHGIPDAFRGYDFTGRTDPGILHDAFQRHLGREPSLQEVRGACDRYLEHLESELARDPCGVRVLPGVRPLIEALRDAGTVAGLATGNLERGARLKLGAAGLGGLLPFGGFGSDHRDRAALTRLAADRGRAVLGAAVPGHRILVVGDSPLDIRAAHDAGLHVLSVLTGWTSGDALRRLGPEHLLEDLSDTAAVLRLIAGGGRTA